MSNFLDQLKRASQDIQKNTKRGGISMIETTGEVLNKVYGLSLPLNKLYRIRPSSPDHIKASEIEEIGEQHD